MRRSTACREPLPAWAAARDWECPAASPIMGPAPAWLRFVPERASAACEPAASVVSMAPEWGVSPIQWLAASQAEAMRAGPATVAATHAGLGRRVDEIKDGFLCLVLGLVRLGAVPLRVDEDRDGLRCRADARDKAEPSVGRRDCARACHPDAGRSRSCGQWRTDAARVRATGSTREGGRHARWVVPVHQAAPQTGVARGKREKRLAARKGRGPGRTGRAGRAHRVSPQVEAQVLERAADTGRSGTGRKPTRAMAGRKPGRMGGWPVPCRVTIVTLAARPMCWPRRPP